MYNKIVYFEPILVEDTNKLFRELYIKGVKLNLYLKQNNKNIGNIFIDKLRKITLELYDNIELEFIPYSMKEDYLKGKRYFNDYDFWLYFQGNFGSNERLGISEDLAECGLNDFDEIDSMLINLGKGPNRYYFEYDDKELKDRIDKYLEHSYNEFYNIK